MAVLTKTAPDGSNALTISPKLCAVSSPQAGFNPVTAPNSRPSSLSPQETPMKYPLTLLLTLTAVAQAAPIKVGMVYDAGTRMDKSFNQLAFEGSTRAQKELGATVTHFDFDARPNAIPAQMKKFAAENYNLVFGVGYNNQGNIDAAAKANPKMNYVLVDSVSDQPNVAGLVFAEEEGSYLAGYIAAKSSSTGVIGFIGGMNIPLIYKFAAGYKAGARAANPNIKIYSRYVSTTESGWNDPKTAYKQSGELVNTYGADIIYAAAGNSGTGVIKYVNEQQCVTKAKLPAGVSFKQDRFASVPKSAAYTAKCKGNSRPLFFIGVDANQNYLGDDDKKRGTLNHGLTSMVKRVDVAVYSTIKSASSGTFKGGANVLGLEQGGVAYAYDEYNKALISRELFREVEQAKNRIIRKLIRVPQK